METEFCLENYDLSPICGFDTQVGQTPVSQKVRYPVKMNLQSNPMSMNVRKQNDYQLNGENNPPENKFKIIKYNGNNSLQNGSIRDFSENFVAKRIPVEKGFVRINYLKNKEKEIKTAEDLIAPSTINSTINQSNVALGKSTQKKENKQKANVSKSISKTAINESSEKKTQIPKKRSSISNSTKYAPPSARSTCKKDLTTPLKDKNSFIERRSNKQSISNNTQQRKSSHKIINNSSSSCCSCCKSQNSPFNSVERQIAMPSDGVQSSAYHSMSQRAQSVKSKKSNYSGLRSSFNINFDLSSEWNHKSSILSSSGCNKTSEYLQKKIQKIFERKQEKEQIKQIHNSEKIIRNELYGIFSRQSRELKQKKQQELSILEQMKNQISQTVDPEKIQQVDELVHKSIEQYILKKKIQEEEKQQEEQEKVLLIQKRKDFDLQVKQNNYVQQEKRSKSRDNSKQKEIQYKPWGIDQRKFDIKPRTQENQNQDEMKVVKKEQIDLKHLFSKNETINQMLKQIKIEQKKKTEEELQRVKQGKHSKSSTHIRPEKKINQEDFNKKMEERLQKIIEQKKNQAKEIRKKKNDINEKLEKVENERKESISKCRKVPFKPSQQLIDKAFNIIENEKEKIMQDQQVMQNITNELVEQSIQQSKEQLQNEKQQRKEKNNGVKQKAEKKQIKKL